MSFPASRTPKSFSIGGRPIGSGHPAFIIAEAGVNHDGDLARAHALVAAAAEAGADAVKFQTWVTELICAPDADAAAYQRQAGYESQFKMLQKLELKYEWHAELKAHAESCGLVFLSTPDELQSARFLVELGVKALKIGSAEVRNVPHLASLAAMGRPLIMSTGMSTTREIETAVDAIFAAADVPLALLHCVSAYPAREEDMNLRCIETLRNSFGVAVGLSDHTPGHHVAVLATGVGMPILEKHMTLDRGSPGPDHQMSMLPDEFGTLVQEVRRAERILGAGIKRITDAEAETIRVTRRTLRYSRSLPEGHVVSDHDLIAVRGLADGIGPEGSSLLIGRLLVRRVEELDLAFETDVAPLLHERGT